MRQLVQDPTEGRVDEISFELYTHTNVIIYVLFISLTQNAYCIWYHERNRAENFLCHLKIYINIEIMFQSWQTHVSMQESSRSNRWFFILIFVLFFFCMYIFINESHTKPMLKNKCSIMYRRWDEWKTIWAMVVFMAGFGAGTYGYHEAWNIMQKCHAVD